MLAPFGARQAKAQDTPAPERARISLVQGNVAIRQGACKEWLAATANAPLASDDTIATGPVSRAEVQLDYASVLRLDQSAEVVVADLTRTRIQLQVASGRVNVGVFPGTQADVELDTPNMAVHLRGEGNYRLEVTSSDYSQLTVLRGFAEVFAGRGSVNVPSGQAIEVKGTADPDYQLVQAGLKDGWDRWNDQRDRAIADAQSWKYTNRYYTGSEDLDRYGDWVEVPGYDWCWTPYAQAGWVPYRKGRWVSDAYYQWIWVGYEPWGWTPYHYGRWLLYNGDWCWWPGLGPKGAAPVWAPGYVAFFGLGGRPATAGASVEFDSIGWCPLGPHDRFDPWWGAGHTFNTIEIASVNAAPPPDSAAGQVSGSNLQGILADPNLRGAVTTLSVQNFASGHSGNDLYPVNQSILEQGSLIQGPLPVTPAPSSLQPVDRPVNRAALPAAGTNPHFVTRNIAPASRGSDSAPPISPLASAQRPGGSLPAQSASLGPEAPQGVTGPHENPILGTGPPAEPASTPAGWRRFTWNRQITHSPPSVNQRDADGKQPAAPPPPNAPPSASNQTSTDNQNSWRRFSPPPNSASHGGNVSSPEPDGWKRFGSPKDSNTPALTPRGDEYKI